MNQPCSPKKTFKQMLKPTPQQPPRAQRNPPVTTSSSWRGDPFTCRRPMRIICSKSPAALATKLDEVGKGLMDGLMDWWHMDGLVEIVWLMWLIFWDSWLMAWILIAVFCWQPNLDLIRSPTLQPPKTAAHFFLHLFHLAIQPHLGDVSQFLTILDHLGMVWPKPIPELNRSTPGWAQGEFRNDTTFPPKKVVVSPVPCGLTAQKQAVWSSWNAKVGAPTNYTSCMLHPCIFNWAHMRTQSSTTL